MNLNVQLQEKDDGTYVLNVEVDAESVKETWDAVVREFLPRVRVPGFRAGRVPRPVLERRFGDQIREDVEARLVKKALPEAIQSQDVNVARWWLVERDEASYGRPFRFTAALEVWPRLEHVEWKGLVVKRPQISLSEEDVHRRIEQLRESQAVLEPLDDSHVITTEDLVAIDYEPVEGENLPREPQKLFVDLSSATDDDPIVVACRTRILGRKKGDTMELSLGEGETASGSGGNARVRIMIRQVYRKVLPELDEDFVRSVSSAVTVNEFRELVRAELESTAKAHAEAALRSALIDALISKNEPLRVPASVVREEAMRMAHRELRRAGVPTTTAVRLLEERSRELVDPLLPLAEREVKGAVLLRWIGEKSGIQVSEDEVAVAVEKQMERLPEDRPDLSTAVRSKENRERVRDAIWTRKVVDLLVHEAQVIEE